MSSICTTSLSLIAAVAACTVPAQEKEENFDEYGLVNWPGYVGKLTMPSYIITYLQNDFGSTIFPQDGTTVLRPYGVEDPRGNSIFAATARSIADQFYVFPVVGNRQRLVKSITSGNYDECRSFTRLRTLVARICEIESAVLLKENPEFSLVQIPENNSSFLPSQTIIFFDDHGIMFFSPDAKSSGSIDGINRLVDLLIIAKLGEPHA